MKTIFPATLLCDFYKISHRDQYPENTQYVFSTWTPRASLLKRTDRVIAFGFQGFIKKYLIKYFNEHFFSRPKEDVVNEYKTYLKYTLGTDADATHIEELHDLGYLPICIKAVEEGTSMPIRVPILTITNTLPKFYWITNYLETLMSCCLWQPTTSATIGFLYRQILEKYAKETNEDALRFVDFQGHDFSMRGMAGVESAVSSGAGHLLSFTGSDTIPAISYLIEYYKAELTKELIASSIPACYDPITEVLTDKGWKYFMYLDETDLVAQYHEDGHIDFVQPLAYYNMKYEGDMIYFGSGGNHYVDMMVTPNHRMVKRHKPTGVLQIFEAGDQDKNGYHSNNEVIVSGLVKDGFGMTPLDRLRVAFQADGSFPSRKDSYTGAKTECYPIRFALKKDRKINRLKEICDAIGCEYTANKDASGYTNFWIKLGIQMYKNFNEWINLLFVSKQWADDFVDELQYWDGHKHTTNTTTFSSINKANTDIVQCIVALSGRKSQYNMYIDGRGDRQPMHYLTILENKTSVGGNNAIKTVVNYKGTVHCVSVPTRMLVVRRNNVVAISGNTEHSVMCAYGKDNEFEAYRRFIQDVYPNGFVSIVSDTYDLWYVLNTIIAGLKEEILARDGKVVIRPDSGDPVKIVCGDPESENPFARKGVVEVLWDIFGGTISKEGYKVLDSHIGCIYGDAITLDRCEQICEKLKAKGFASTNMVYGIGSFTYQYNTRDTFGMALKSTHVIVDGEAKNIFKDPITDTNKIKKSQKGLVDVVKRANGSIEYIDAEKIENGEGMAEGDFSILQTIFYNGSLFNEQSLSNIRAKVKESL